MALYTPLLYHTGENSYLKDEKGQYKQFSALPQDLTDAIFSNLSNDDGNLIKLMCLLAGTKADGSFRVANTWVCKHTGMSTDEYDAAKRALLDKGWLTRKDVKDDSCYDLCINFDAILNGYRVA